MPAIVEFYVVLAKTATLADNLDHRESQGSPARRDVVTRGDLTGGKLEVGSRGVRAVS